MSFRLAYVLGDPERTARSLMEIGETIPDRSGGPGGGYVGRDRNLFSERAVRPDRLSFVRTSFDIDLDRARQVAIRAEQSRVVPAFEQPGAVRNISSSGQVMTRR